MSSERPVPPAENNALQTVDYLVALGRYFGVQPDESLIGEMSHSCDIYGDNGRAILMVSDDIRFFLDRYPEEAEPVAVDPNLIEAELVKGDRVTQLLGRRLFGHYLRESSIGLPQFNRFYPEGYLFTCSLAEVRFAMAFRLLDDILLDPIKKEIPKYAFSTIKA